MLLFVAGCVVRRGQLVSSVQVLESTIPLEPNGYEVGEWVSASGCDYSNSCALNRFAKNHHPLRTSSRRHRLKTRRARGYCNGCEHSPLSATDPRPPSQCPSHRLWNRSKYW